MTSWAIYRAVHGAVWLGTVDATDEAAMLHSAPWRPNYEEAEQAERQDKMNELRQR
jgi:hypothetical protein